MKKIWTILPVMAVLSAAPAFAQDSDFGPRVEVRAGHDELRGEIEIRDSANTDKTSENGIGYGVEIGMDARVSTTFLVGVYAGLDLSDIDQCSGVFRNVTGLGNDEACIDAGRNFTAGLRAGLPMGDGGLIYVKAGYSNAKIRASYSENADNDAALLFSDSDTVGGYHLGAGAELGLGVLGLSSDFYVKGEYVHSRYRNAFNSELDDGESFNPTRHQILVGVGVRF